MLELEGPLAAAVARLPLPDALALWLAELRSSTEPMCTRPQVPVSVIVVGAGDSLVARRLLPLHPFAGLDPSDPVESLCPASRVESWERGCDSVQTGRARGREHSFVHHVASCYRQIRGQDLPYLRRLDTRHTILALYFRPPYKQRYRARLVALEGHRRSWQCAGQDSSSSTKISLRNTSKVVGRSQTPSSQVRYPLIRCALPALLSA